MGKYYIGSKGRSMCEIIIPIRWKARWRLSGRVVRQANAEETVAADFFNLSQPRVLADIMRKWKEARKSDEQAEQAEAQEQAEQAEQAEAQEPMEEQAEQAEQKKKPARRRKRKTE